MAPSSISIVSVASKSLRERSIPLNTITSSFCTSSPRLYPRTPRLGTVPLPYIPFDYEPQPRVSR